MTDAELLSVGAFIDTEGSRKKKKKKKQSVEYVKWDKWEKEEDELEALVFEKPLQVSRKSEETNDEVEEVKITFFCSSFETHEICEQDSKDY